MTDGSIVVDCAGGRVGGAQRYLNELDLYLARRRSPGIHVIGREQRLTPSWLAQREVRAGLPKKAVAINNVGFVSVGEHRVVLLANALHFLQADEADQLGFCLPREIRLQAQVVRAAARRADTIVVPSSEMADRVSRTAPYLTQRLVVRFHPVSPPLQVPDPAPKRAILCPVVFSTYKRMASRIRVILAATQILAAPPYCHEVELLVTASEADIGFPNLLTTSRLRLIGRHSPTALQQIARKCFAIIYPTQIESFGYPLAEARVSRQPVVALDTSHNREIAGKALTPYGRETPEEIAGAIYAALHRSVPEVPRDLFDREAYFDWLLGG